MKTKMRVMVLVVFLGLMTLGGAARAATATTFYLGADLSYVDEMEDCGAVYQVNGKPEDPYQIFHDNGANLVRLRLWNDPTWTKYSTLDDVIRASKQVKALGMDVLLDFHYSDTWADPSKQIIPAAWANITDQNELGKALYQYTFDVLTKMDSEGVMPAMVQVGNEINTEILRPENAPGYPINWDRNAFLLNQAIKAVRDAGAKSSVSPRIMIHIAQPENVEGWFVGATDAGVTDYDVIGVSYYPRWSTYSLKTVGNAVRQIGSEFGKDVIIAETAYPWTFADVPGSMPDDLKSDALEPGYPATPDGQRQFMIDLTQTVFNNGGTGVIYWEPAWVSTKCKTLWGTGSSRDNTAFFDFKNKLETLPGIQFLEHDNYTYPVDVALKFHFDTASSTPAPIFFWGDFTGMGRRLITLNPNADGDYVLPARLMPGTDIQYQFYKTRPPTAENALLPANCANADGHMAFTVPQDDVTVDLRDSACPA